MSRRTGSVWRPITPPVTAAGAVRAFHECVVTFDRELGVDPSAETASMYASLIEHAQSEAPGPRHPSVRARPGLVGRDDEWQQLTVAWDAAQQGGPAVVLVVGEAGIGKTRIVEELRTWCSTAGAAIGEARSYVTGGDLGYAVVAAWLRCPDVAAGQGDMAPGERTELARLLPELGIPSPPDGFDDAVRRRRLFDAAVAALTATERPTLLIADDAQWSDPESHDFIHYLVRRPIGVPLLLVLTARQDDLDSAHPLTVLRDELLAIDRVSEVRLERLERLETAELGSQLLGEPLSDEAADALFSGSEGNPLFVVETVRAGWDGTESSMPLSPKLRAVIDSRLRRLSHAAAKIARSAAVVGRPCSAGVLGRLSRARGHGIGPRTRRAVASGTAVRVGQQLL